jgi:hypothetical protein
LWRSMWNANFSTKRSSNRWRIMFQRSHYLKLLFLNALFWICFHQVNDTPFQQRIIVIRNWLQYLCTQVLKNWRMPFSHSWERISLFENNFVGWYSKTLDWINNCSSHLYATNQLLSPPLLPPTPKATTHLMTNTQVAITIMIYETSLSSQYKEQDKESKLSLSLNKLYVY